MIRGTLLTSLIYMQSSKLAIININFHFHNYLIAVLRLFYDNLALYAFMSPYFSKSCKFWLKYVDVRNTNFRMLKHRAIRIIIIIILYYYCHYQYGKND